VIYVTFVFSAIKKKKSLPPEFVLQYLLAPISRTSLLLS